MTGTTHIGPIIFSDPTARNQLLDHGEVVTFCTSRRTVGETWWRESRTGVKQGDVTVSLIGPADPADPDDLREHRPLSGFGSIESWQAAIEDLNGALTSSADADPKPILWEHLTTHVWRLPVITEVGL